MSNEDPDVRRFLNVFEQRNMKEFLLSSEPLSVSLDYTRGSDTLLSYQFVTTLATLGPQRESPEFNQFDNTVFVFSSMEGHTAKTILLRSVDGILCQERLVIHYMPEEQVIVGLHGKPQEDGSTVVNMCSYGADSYYAILRGGMIRVPANSYERDPNFFMTSTAWRDCDLCISRGEPCKCSGSMKRRFFGSLNRGMDTNVPSWEFNRKVFALMNGPAWFRVDHLENMYRADVDFGFKQNVENLQRIVSQATLKNARRREFRVRPQILDSEEALSGSSCSQPSRDADAPHAVRAAEKSGGRSLHVCDVCGKSFRYPYGLKRHREGVHEEKKYRCTVCGGGFSQKEYLATHMEQLHGQRRIYKCSICGATFGWKANMNKHWKTHHQGASKTGKALAAAHVR